MIDDSTKSHPAHLSEEDAKFLASLLVGEPPTDPVADVSTEGELVLDLTESPTLTFEPSPGVAEMLTAAGSGYVSDLVDVALVLSTKPSAEVIARSIFGRPEPIGTVTRRASSPRAAVVTVGGSHGTSQDWFHPVVGGSAAASVGTDPFAPEPKPELESTVVVRLNTAAGSKADHAVIFSAAGVAADRRQKVMLAALFLGAVAIGAGLMAVLAGTSLINGSDGAANPGVEVVTTLAPTPTTAAPTTAAPATAVPTTAVPTTVPPATAAPTTTVPATTEAPTTTAAPTTAVPVTTAAPTTRAPRTTSRPATTQPPATAPPTTTAPTVTFAPPTWADPLE